MRDRGMELGEFPQWVEDAFQLPAFCTGTAKDWGKVIREMIREQVAEFHTLPEWETQRNTARQGGRDGRGEIQNAILDDIMSALKGIAPAAKMPNPGC